jgi:hypothetical protein
MSGRTRCPDTRACSPFLEPLRVPTRVCTTLNVTNIEKRGRGGGCPAGAGRRRRHKGEVVEAEDGDATPDLLLKHSDETHATYV